MADTIELLQLLAARGVPTRVSPVIKIPGAVTVSHRGGQVGQRGSVSRAVSVEFAGQGYGAIVEGEDGTEAANVRVFEDAGRARVPEGRISKRVMLPRE